MVCDISGYGDSGPYASKKAYDLLVHGKGEHHADSAEQAFEQIAVLLEHQVLRLLPEALERVEAQVGVGRRHVPGGVDADRERDLGFSMNFTMTGCAVGIGRVFDEHTVFIDLTIFLECKFIPFETVICRESEPTVEQRRGIGKVELTGLDHLGACFVVGVVHVAQETIHFDRARLVPVPRFRFACLII